MRALARLAVFAATLLAIPAAAQQAELVPERRLILTRDVDFYGSDLRSIFDTSIQACQTACLTDAACRAFTFNARSGSCFTKSSVSEQQPYTGAYSGWVRDAAPGLAARAATRAGELDFLVQADFAAALDQAKALAGDHITGDWTAEEHLAEAQRLTAMNNPVEAAKFQGAALNLTDAADQWVEYAQLQLDSIAKSSTARQRSLPAAINAYLRADGDAVRVSALAVMAQALEANNRTRRDHPGAAAGAIHPAARRCGGGIWTRRSANTAFGSRNIRCRPMARCPASARSSTRIWCAPGWIIPPS